MKNNPENLKPTSPDSLDPLETVAFHLTHLYQRLAQDRDRWAVTGDDLAEAVETFDKQLQQLATLEERMKQQVTHSLAIETRQVMDQLRDSFRQALQTVLADNIKGTADDLLQMVQEAKYTLKAHQQDMANTRKLWIRLAFVSALFGGVLGGLVLYYLHF